jgi:hypothetical protein
MPAEVINRDAATMAEPGRLAEQHEMPEIPGLGIEDPGRSQPKRLAKGVIAEQLTGRANVLGGPELYELAEQEVRPRERLGGR